MAQRARTARAYRGQPGGRSVTWRGALAVAAIVLGLPAIAAAEPGDVPYYKARPAERAALLRKCQTDVALAMTRECQNAEAADASTIGRPLRPGDIPPDPWFRRGAPPSPPIVTPPPGIPVRRAT